MAVVCVENRDLIVAFVIHNDRNRLSIGRPRADGIDEAQRIEMRIARGRRKLADDVTRLRIGEIQLDTEKVATREECHALSIGTDRRRHILCPVVLHRNYRAADAIRRCTR